MLASDSRAASANMTSRSVTPFLPWSRSSRTFARLRLASTTRSCFRMVEGYFLALDSSSILVRSIYIQPHMSDVPDLLRISPTIKNYLNAVLSDAPDDGLIEALREFELELPGSADRGDEDKRLAVAIRRAVDFVGPTIQAILGPGRFFDPFPVPATHRRPIGDALTDGQYVALAFEDADTGGTYGGAYRPGFGCPYGLIAQEIAQEVHGRSGAYRRHRKAIGTDTARSASQAIQIVAHLGLAREVASSAHVASALYGAYLADRNLAAGIQAVIVGTVNEMLTVQSSIEESAARREKIQAARERVEEARKRLEA